MSSKTFSLYKHDPQVVALFNPAALISDKRSYESGTLINLEGKLKPGAELFNNLTLGESVVSSEGGTGYQLKRNGVPDAYVEPTEQGCDFRFYNAPTPDAATEIFMLCVGDPNVDYISNDVRIEAVKDQHGNIILFNQSLLNNVPYTEAKPNRNLKATTSVRWAIDHVGDNTSGIVYPANKIVGYNQTGGGRSGWMKIGLTPGTPIYSDKTNAADINANMVDYVVKAGDVADTNIERVSLTFIRSTKQESTSLYINLSDLLSL